MKIYDCFPFYNEFELLELRLKSLWDVVDRFVIVEADRTQTNKPKPFYFWERQNEFKEFFPKIRHLPVEMTIDFKGVGDWSIENAQRDAIIYGLEDAAPDDLIMISDADEFPDPDVLQKIRGGQLVDPLNNTPLVMSQKFFCYYFDRIGEGSWYGTILVKLKNLTTPQELRDQRNILPRISGGGYHFSYMGGVDCIRNKMTAIIEGPVLIAHLGEKIFDRKHIEECMAEGKGLYTGDEFLPYDVRNIRLPYLDEFLKKYPYFLREPEKYFGGKNFNEQR